MPTDFHRSSRDSDDPYAGPVELPRSEGSTSRSILFAVAAVTVHVFATAASVVWLMIYGIRSEKVFRDYNVKLDDFTEFALAVSRWLNNYWYVLAIFLLPCFVVDLVAQFLLHRWHRTRVWAWVAAVLILLLVLGCSGLLGNTLYVSTTKLQEQL
jgi:hypothetical protein